MSSALIRPAGDGDRVGGVPARFIATPASTEEAATILAESADLAVVVRGSGTKIDWGMPPDRLDLIIDTSRLTGVVEHAAGDLITVVRAGTRLADLDLPGQQLALDSPFPGATVGGTVAVNVSGPRRTLYGTTRDLLIGITVVRPDGRIARAGGKVVKNVAGYDLGKLYTGSYGTLGLITECAFRLHPLPRASAVVVAAAPDPRAAGRLVAAVLGAQLAPSAVEVDAPPDGPIEVAVLLEGSPAGVTERTSVLQKLLGGSVVPGGPSWWGRMPWADGDVGIKLTAPLSRVPEVVAAARECGVAVRGSAGSGVLYAGMPAGGGVSSGCAEQSLGETTVSDLAPGVSSGSAEQSLGETTPSDLAGGVSSASPEQSLGETTPSDHAPGVSSGCSEQRAAEVVRVVEYLRATATRAGGHAVVLTAPPAVRQIVDMWGPVGGLALMRRVKDQFDPGHRFAPGRFVGGI